LSGLLQKEQFKWKDTFLDKQSNSCLKYYRVEAVTLLKAHINEYTTPFTTLHQTLKKLTSISIRNPPHGTQSGRQVFVLLGKGYMYIPRGGVGIT